MRIDKELPPEYVVKNMRVLKTIRQGRGMTQKQAAEACGLFVIVRFTDYEKYGALPTRENYNKLALFLGWEVWE